MSAPATSRPDPFTLADGDFRMIADIVYRKAGIVVRDHKQAMVRGRLMRRARELGLASIEAYCALLRGPGLDAELSGLLNALTTNHTAFFREAHHFDHLAAVTLPWALSSGASRVRLWCAAASTGEEPYTIAAVMLAALKSGSADVKLLATDIDSNVIARGEAGLYAGEAFAALSKEQQGLLKAEPAGAGEFRMPEPLRRLISFRRLNIIEDWPFQGPFQAIFCRNMLIYFDQPTKTRLIDRFVGKLTAGGYLYLGHSEAMTQVHPALESCGRTVYRKR